jgi:hypothetical protein
MGGAWRTLQPLLRLGATCLRQRWCLDSYDS